RGTGVGGGQARRAPPAVPRSLEGPDGVDLERVRRRASGEFLSVLADDAPERPPLPGGEAISLRPCRRRVPTPDRRETVARPGAGRDLARVVPPLHPLPRYLLDQGRPPPPLPNPWSHDAKPCPRPQRD